MICRYCGKYVNGNKCIYCGKSINAINSSATIAFTQESGAEQVVSKDVIGVEIDNNLNQSSTQDHTGIHEYNDYDTSATYANTPEGFYKKYKDTNVLEKSKDILNKLSIIVTIIDIILVVLIVYLVATENEIILEVFGYDSHISSDEEILDFIYKLLIVIIFPDIILGLLACVKGIIDWRSMICFSEEVTKNNVNGNFLLTESRLSDSKGKKEYIFVSNSLCMIDEPTQKNIIGIRVILRICLFIITCITAVNFLSFLISNLMYIVDEIGISYIYTSEFWLNTNVLSFVIVFWATLIINSVMGLIVNRKYTQWVNKYNTKGE